MIRYLGALTIEVLLTASAWGQAPFVLRNDPPAIARKVVVDQVASASVLSASGTTLNFTNQSITAGLNDPALVVFVTQSTNVNVSGMTAVWDSGGTNQSMTQVSTLATANGQVWIFARLAPTSGNSLTLALSWTGTGQVFVSSFSLKNVLQTSVATAFLHATNGSGGTTPSIAVTSQANDLVASVWASLGTFSGTFSGTPVYSNNAGITWDGAASYDTGTASVTATAGATSTNWLGASIDVVHD